MPFDMAKFESVKIVDRTEEVPVPELQSFFEDEEIGEGETRAIVPGKAVWTVKALGGLEIAEAREAMARNRSLEALLSGLISGDSKEKVQALKDSLGIASDTAPDDYVYRLACLRLGSVDPVLNEEQAVRLALAFSVTFYNLTNKILQLSGMGKRLGE
jgi:hypothetical protein